jgi:lipopolysaccharide export system permease protein
VGKGIPNQLILKLILLVAPNVLPFALPLGILLAAIMTYGNLSERSELTAIKSAGISLLKFSRPLILLAASLTFLTFLVYNYITPVSNLKFYTLLSDITHTKPAVNIKPGVFYREIPGYSIYVNSKGNDQISIQGIMIYDHTSGIGNDKLILAQKGKMYVTKDKKYLIFELNNGTRYEERKGKDKEEEMLQLSFQSWKKVFDLSSFALQQSDENFLRHNESMLSNQKVSLRLDSMAIFRKKINSDNLKNLGIYFPVLNLDSAMIKTKKSIPSPKMEFTISQFSDSIQEKILYNADNQLKNAQSIIEIFKNDNFLYESNTLKLKVEWHKKIANSINIFILFLIGIPLGAIIRKGGFGAPFVAAVIFFVIFYVLITNFAKMSEQGKIIPAVGMWIPNLFFASIAIFLFYFANKDSKLFKRDTYQVTFKKIFSRNGKEN